MTRNLKRRSIEAFPDADTANLHDFHPLARSPRELVAGVQRIVDDLTVVTGSCLCWETVRLNDSLC